MKSHDDLNNLFIYDNIVNLLFDKIPEYYERKKYHNHSNGLVYLIFGGFSSFLFDKIINDDIDEIVIKSFSFLNEMGKSEDEKVRTLLQVGVLETFTENPKCVKVARDLLKGISLELFEELSDYLTF